MFNLLRSAVTSAYNAIKSAVAPKPAPRPAPRPVYTAPKIAPIPAPSFRPIANYGESSASIAARTRAWAASPAAKAQQAWITAPSSAANASRALAAQRQAAARAEAARLAEIARKAELRRKAQTDLDGRVKAFTGIGKAAADKAAAFLKAMTGGKKKDGGKTGYEGFSSQAEADSFNKWFKQQTPERQAEVTAFNQTKNEYEARAKRTVDGTKKGVTGWFGYSANTKARSFAEQQATKISTDQVKRYETTLNSFLKTQASRKASLEAKKASGSITQKDIDEYVKWETDNVKSLEYTRAATTGLLAGYGSKASEKLNDPISRAGSWFNKNVTHGLPGKITGGIFNYTLGQGDKDKPSVFTAPGRAVNTLLNWTGISKQRNYHEGKVDSSKVTSLSDAWQKSFNQRNLNWSQPNKDKSDAAFEKWYKTRDTSGMKGVDPKKVREMYKKAFYSQRDNDIAANYTAEAFADPIMGVGKLGRGAVSGVKAIAKPAASSGWFGKSSAALSKLKTTKPGKALSWLNADHQTYSQRKNKFVQEELDDIYQKRPEVRKLLRKWQENKVDIKATEKTRISDAVNQQFAEAIVKNAGMQLNKSNSERFLRAVQEVARGKSVDDLADFTPRERQAVAKLSQDLRTKLDDFYDAENTASLPRTDVTIDPRTGKKTFTRSKVQPVDSYSYRKGYIPQYNDGFKASLQKRKPKKGAWWFTKEQKTQRIQSTRELTKSLSAREYADTTARQNFPVQRDVVGGRKDIAENFDRIDNVDKYVKRTKWEQAMRVGGLPMQAWKKAVLLGSPAWYANNEIFNQIQGISAGGLRFIKNQRGSQKYLKHVGDNASARMRPSLAQKRVTDIGSNINKEVGGSKLGKLASKQETRARVALYRTFRQDGLSHEKAVKKVNDNLFDYSTKNYERPIKSVAPFYAWTKGLTKASVKMPLQKPKTAMTFNELDRNQQQQFDTEFETIKPQLKDLGYTDAEIETIRTDNAKYYKGRFKIGDKWFTTPFNAFSERGLSNVGFNPYAAAAGEAGDAVDYYGQTTKGKDATLTARIMSKFPQANLGKKALGAWSVHTGKAKPTEGWIGKKGSEGYGLTKEKQGYDSSKPNYNRKMDPRAGLAQDALAFAGIPRFMEFDKGKLVETKRMQKVKDAYFALDTKDMKYKEADEARQAIFKKYGITADDFYKGILAKYDTENTKRIKGQKEAAAAKNKSLFDEYAAQPKGTRNIWATQKLRQLVKDGYFNDNPFLKSFSWMSAESVAKADKQAAYKEAKRTGNWTKYNTGYSDARKPSAKSLAYKKAKQSGDWTEYRKSYGTKRSSPHQFEGKFFKSAESMKKYKDGLFWKQYAKADKAARRKLLADNPQYNDRKNWTDAQWDEANAVKKAAERTKLRAWGNFALAEAENLSVNKKKAERFMRTRVKKQRKLSWRLS